jgi:hypothetical protein
MEKKKEEEIEKDPELAIKDPMMKNLDYQRGIEENEASLTALKRELKLFRKQYDFNVKQRANFEIEVNRQKKKMKMISQSKRDFYLHLLKQGFDSR